MMLVQNYRSVALYFKTPEAKPVVAQSFVSIVVVETMSIHVLVFGEISRR